MKLWHGTPGAPRRPARVGPGQMVELGIGTWPIEPGQSVWVTWECVHADGARDGGRSTASWRRNAGADSYWSAEIGPFREGDHVSCKIHGSCRDGGAETSELRFDVRAALRLALLWHQHQPLYRDPAGRSAAGSYLHPWVRLHAIRDYYSMPAIAAEHGVRMTFNLTPVLLLQLQDYLERGATDRALELTRRRAERLGGAAAEELFGSFFDADWHHQIYPLPRYRQLLEQRAAGHRFTTQDIRDLQMCFNLAWFGYEFRSGTVELVTGETASVKDFVSKERGFTHDDIEAMIAEQYKIMRAIVPLHRALQDRGAIEVSTTPAYHPILPLLIDTDQATIDRPGAVHPPRFAHPEDAEAHVRLACDVYRRSFGRVPRGMWPAEGAVSPAALEIVARHAIRWVATDRGVLARSGRWGYEVSRPEVLCRPYRFAGERADLAVFFRDTDLSDAVGFRYQEFSDPRAAAEHFVAAVESAFLERLPARRRSRVRAHRRPGRRECLGRLRPGRPALPPCLVRAGRGRSAALPCDLLGAPRTRGGRLALPRQARARA